MHPRISIRGSVRLSVRWSIGPSIGSLVHLSVRLSVCIALVSITQKRVISASEEGGLQREVMGSYEGGREWGEYRYAEGRI